MKTCKCCGAVNVDDAKTCPKCGEASWAALPVAEYKGVALPKSEPELKTYCVDTPAPVAAQERAPYQGKGRR